MSDIKERTLTIEKIFDAPLTRVWDAWTQADHITKWWAPEGIELKVVEHDFKLGGKWKYSMLMPDGSEFISEGTYIEIIELKKIVSVADFKPMTENVELHALFEAQGDKSRFIFNVVHDTADYCKRQEEIGFYTGWSAAFTRLEHLVDRRISRVE